MSCKLWLSWASEKMSSCLPEGPLILLGIVLTGLAWCIDSNHITLLLSTLSSVSLTLTHHCNGVSELVSALKWPLSEMENCRGPALHQANPSSPPITNLCCRFWPRTPSRCLSTPSCTTRWPTQPTPCLTWTTTVAPPGCWPPPPWGMCWVRWLLETFSVTERPLLKRWR